MVSAFRFLRLPCLAISASLFCIWLGIWLSFFSKYENAAGWFLLTQRSLSLDAAWYRSIAIQGYAWNPHELAGHKLAQQNIAFFPLYPLLEKAMGYFFGNAPSLIMIAPAFFAMLASIILFYVLARFIQPDRPAARSTLAFALFPASIFCFTGYPTSLMNLLCILAILLAFRGKWILSAAAAGAATAAGPLTVFISMSIMVFYLFDAVEKKTPVAKTFSVLVVLAFLSFSGLLGFMLYQTIMFGTPVAFMAAQAAWGTVTFPQRLENLLTMHSVFSGGFNALFQSIIFSGHDPRRSASQFEQFLNGLTCLTIIAAYAYLLISHFKHRQFSDNRHKFGLFAGISVFAGYQWFVGSITGPEAANRLLFLSFPAFFALGALSQRRPRLADTILMTEALFLMLQAFFFFSGFYVI